MKLRLIFSFGLAAVAAAMAGCGATGGYNLPPASRLMEPGPGVGGPGPGVMAMPNPGIVQTAGHVSVEGGLQVPTTEVQVLFARPENMQVAFDAGGSFDSTPIITPARQNFTQGGIYRLKVSGMPGREGTELYPTLELGPPTRQTAAYLAHNAIPIQFTEEDFDQVMSGNFVTKVIYLPDPDSQILALAGVETLVSTRLDPGLDPIVEADRRGSIMAVVRIGNKDMEVPGANISTANGTGGQGGLVVPANYGAAVVMPAESTVGIAQTGFACSTCGPSGCTGRCGSTAAAPGGLPAGLAGAGAYGMPVTGTPIGLPGPPHVPLGVPAGLKQHVMRNWTKRHIPDPVGKVKINVKQRPGLSYSQPPNRAWVVEDTIHSAPHFSNRHFGLAPSPANDCPDGSCHTGGLLGGLKGLLRH